MRSDTLVGACMFIGIGVGMIFDRTGSLFKFFTELKNRLLKVT